MALSICGKCKTPIRADGAEIVAAIDDHKTRCPGVLVKDDDSLATELANVTRGDRRRTRK